MAVHKMSDEKKPPHNYPSSKRINMKSRVVQVINAIPGVEKLSLIRQTHKSISPIYWSKK